MQPQSKLVKSVKPVMDATQAIATLSANWTANVNMWKYKGCSFGDDPTQWPPRVLVALAVLSRVAGPTRRIQAMHLISQIMGNGVASATTEHIAKATKMLKESLDPLPINDVTKLHEKMVQKLAEKDSEIEAVKEEWYEMDANLLTATVDRDMFEMYYTTERDRVTALGKENAALEREAAAKDTLIMEVTAERDDAFKRCAELETELSTYRRLAGGPQHRK